MNYAYFLGTSIATSAMLFEYIIMHSYIILYINEKYAHLLFVNMVLEKFGYTVYNI